MRTSGGDAVDADAQYHEHDNHDDDDDRHVRRHHGGRVCVCVCDACSASEHVMV